MKMLHEGKDGKVSSMRVMCMMSLVAAIVFAYIAITGHGSNDATMIITGFLVSAFAPKAVQKFAEKDL